MKGDQEYLTIGGEKVPLEKITFKEWRSINPLKGKWIGYWWPGIGYYKISRGTTEGAREKQIRLILNDDAFRSTQRTFPARFTFIALYVYNELLRSKAERQLDPLEKTWIQAIDHATKKKLTKEELLRIEQVPPHLKFQQKKDKIEPWIQGKVKELFWLWLSHLYSGDVVLKECVAGDCKRLFRPSRSDQRSCSDQCKARTLERGYRRKKKLFLSST
ncbi:hypothetical protein ES707_18326 [subsurface metagenome]